MWIVRPNEKSGYDLLLQKRSRTKDSNPGCYDISSAGHMEAGSEPLPSALREIREELGLSLSEEDLEYVGLHSAGFTAVFYGKPFRDRELSHVYICRKEIREEDLHLQAEEVEEVRWMDFAQCLEGVRTFSIDHCIYEDELLMLASYLHIPV
jgi:8-oxo-dGTP diphosphatase